MNLVIDEVMQLQHVEVTDSHLLLERITCASIEQDRLTVFRQAGFDQAVANFLFGRPVEDGADRRESQL